MKFVSIFTVSQAAWAAPASEKEMAEMGKLIGDMHSAGVLIDTGGVMSDGAGFRVRRENSKISVTDGPFTEAKEVIGGFALLRVDSKDEAIAWTRRFLECAGEGTAELHEVTEFS